MKFCYLWICIFAAIIAPCRSEFEFGRAAFDNDGDILLLEDEEALMRDLMMDDMMSMSMSMSMSFSYWYGDGSGSNSDDEGGSNGDGVDGGDGSPTTQNIPSPSASPASTPTTLASPSSVVGPSSSPATAPATAPVSAVGSPSTNSPPVLAADSACFDLPKQDFVTPIPVSTNRSSLSLAVLENLLEDEMRKEFPFCEDITNALNVSGYYIGNVDLVEDEDGETCTPRVTAKNCFIVGLSLQLFGNATDEDATDISTIVTGLLKSDSMGEALGVENGLIDWNDDSTETDAGQNSGDPQASTKPSQMTDGRKALIGVALIVGVALIALIGVAYHRRQGGVHGYDATEGNDDGNGSGQRPMAVTAADRDHFYGA